MSRIDRLYRIHDLLRSARRPVPMRRFMEELEASRNTVTRDFEYLRDVLGAPLEYCREENGHRYNPDSPVFELPGLWMNASELYALLACEHLLESIQPGFIANRVAPLKTRIRALLGESGHDAQRVNDRVQIKPIQTRSISENVIGPVAEATLGSHQLTFTYNARSKPGSELRTVHPQRLLNYRNNWYLVAFCENASAIRLFSLDRISVPAVGAEPSRELEPAQLDRFALSSFGIFSGTPIATARLLFSNHAAKWVAEETWHVDQIGQWTAIGYELRVPYSDTREIAMEILRYGADVQVLEPEELRRKVATTVQKMSYLY